ncbi:MAG: hypothetical protein ACJZ12_01825 [Candidatus Neomarinimicrobiota bacterium]
MKKILLIGNQNNNFFSLCRFLRDKNYNANLLLMQLETKHHIPEADSYDNNFNHYVTEGDLSRLPTGFFNTEKQYVNDLIYDYDIIIGCGLTPAYINKIGKKLDIFIPYGSDLMFQPFYGEKNIFDKKILKILNQTYHQKKGIQHTRNIIIPITNPLIDNCIDKLSYGGNRIISHIPFIYSKQYDRNILKAYVKKSNNKILNDYVKLRERSDFVVFHHLRHGWKDLNSHDYKGNDKVIIGFKKFLNDSIAENPMLILFEHGVDKDQSKLLIKELNIERYVKWFPIQYRRDIMCMIDLCDVGIGEVGHMSTITYGSLCEFMCMSKPIIGNLDVKYNLEHNQEIYPIYNVNNDNDVFKALSDIFSNQNEAKKSGRENKIWFDNNVIDKGLTNIINAIES